MRSQSNSTLTSIPRQALSLSLLIFILYGGSSLGASMFFLYLCPGSFRGRKGLNHPNSIEPSLPFLLILMYENISFLAEPSSGWYDILSVPSALTFLRYHLAHGKQIACASSHQHPVITLALLLAKHELHHTRYHGHDRQRRGNSTCKGNIPSQPILLATKEMHLRARIRMKLPSFSPYLLDISLTRGSKIADTMRCSE